jgi:hypothetical protein
MINEMAISITNKNHSRFKKSVIFSNRGFIIEKYFTRLSNYPADFINNCETVSYDI